MDSTNQHRSVKDLVENLLFLAQEPLSLKHMTDSLPHTKEEVAAALDALQAEYSDRSLKLRFVSGGWQLTTDPALTGEIENFFNLQRRRRLSRQALETLAVIAYNQPITRADVESVRGVGTSGTIQTLIAAEMIKVVGQKETLGNPFLYGTTEKFLTHFGLGNVDELPPLEFEGEGFGKITKSEPAEKADETVEAEKVKPVDFGLTEQTADVQEGIHQRPA